MAMKRIFKMSVVITVIAYGVLYGQRALVSAAPAGEADASLSQLVEPGQVSADARRTAFGGDGPGHPADFNGDGKIGAADLAVLLGSWGECPDCPADLDGNGMVGASDLAVLLGDWGQYAYNLEIGPVAGLTTAWHHSPDQSAIPLGSTVQFRVVLEPGTPVAWTGATEEYRDEHESVASCEFIEIGQVAVQAEVDDAQDGPSLLESVFDVVETAAADITITQPEVWVDPLVIDENLPEDELNEQTMGYYYGESIAALRDLGNGRYRTSVMRRVYMSAQADPPGFEPLIEWRLDGEARVLGGSHSEVFFSNATLHDVSVGPTDNPAEIEIEIYRVVIIGHVPEGDIIPEGVPVTYTAVTDPPGYEEDITWLASTKYGTGVPILGSGPTFTTQFDDTWGPHPDGGLWQWLGVKGDNATAGQDQKCDADTSCESPASCTFDGIPNVALGQATLSVNDACHLVVDNIGSTGLDGVSQDPLPPDTQQMVTGIACPNFAVSGAGAEASFLMFGNVPEELISELVVENTDGETLRAQADFSPVGVTLYTVQIMLDDELVAEFTDLPEAVAIFPLTDLLEVDCLIKPEYHISYELTEALPISVAGQPVVFGNIIWKIGQDPTSFATVQTKIDNFFTDTGPIEMTFQFAGGV